MRTIAIGDVHGCSLALETLVEQIGPQPDDRLIFLGDYVDRGPDSRGVVEYLLALAFRCQVIPLLGNHESMLLSARELGIPNPFWLQCGGRETLTSYGGSLADIPEEHWEFFRGCRRHYETEHHLFFHANYDPALDPDQQPELLLLWQHITGQIPGPHQSGKTVVVGHTPQRSGQILDLGYLLCIDTACFAGGWLSAIDLGSKKVWQSNLMGEVRDGQL
ncbi:MAG: serine/threonine protein phosphatase [Planctomycetes bacterium]|nr:serine/threonine protein phosphatase [Planctomycetota bacterium]